MTESSGAAPDIVPVVEDLASLRSFLADPARERVAVYYTASWCGACKTHLPAVKELARRYVDSVPLLVVRMDKDVMDGEIVETLGVVKLPTMHLMVRGETRGCITGDNVLEAEKYIFAKRL